MKLVIGAKNETETYGETCTGTSPWALKKPSGDRERFKREKRLMSREQYLVQEIPTNYSTFWSTSEFRDATLSSLKQAWSL